MKFSLQLFIINPVTELVMLSGKPVDLEFASFAEASERVGFPMGAAGKVHSMSITDENGKSERWFPLNGQWQRKDA
jgi:hypothetical protein